MPAVKIASADVTPLGAGVYRVKVHVVNAGYLPTMAAMGTTSREPFPLQIKIELPAGTGC